MSKMFCFLCQKFLFVLHRQNGLGYCSSMARIGVAVSPLIMLLEDIWFVLPSIVFSLVALVAALSASFLPETRNIRLPETIEEVEQTRCYSLFYIYLTLIQTFTVRVKSYKTNMSFVFQETINLHI